MTRGFSPQTILKAAVFLTILTTSTFGQSAPADPNRYLNAVREFADNVLKYGRDTYGPKHTPLFVDGLNIHTHEPVKWISPKKQLLAKWQIDRYGGLESQEWILSNFASQQTLLRTLDGLSALTSDPEYCNAAMQAINYALENLKSPNGLLYWGGSTAYDALSDTVCGDKEGEVLKLDYPYYELMWKADRNATKKLVETIWSAHVIDWSNLEIDRFGLRSEDLEEPWNHEYEGGPTFFAGNRSWGSSNVLTASCLIQAGAILNRLASQQQPLLWSRRLAKRFVDTRHPATGISSITNNVPGWKYDLVVAVHGDHRDTHTAVFPWDLFQAPPRSHYYPENAHAHPWMAFFLVGELLGTDGREFTQWALAELTAWGKSSYRKEQNCFVPMLTDGTSLEGYLWENGPGESTGYNKVRLYPADMSFFWAYSIAYARTGDAFMWEMVRSIALGNGLGDIGQAPVSNPTPQLTTHSSHPYGIFGSLELYNKTKKQGYLEMARRIADNILEDRFHKGFFIGSKEQLYTQLDCFEPLALLRLEAAMRSQTAVVPQPWPGLPLFVHGYRYKIQGVDRNVIYRLTESTTPPLSIEEAAAVGDVDLTRRLIAEGVKVEAFDSLSYMTPLHRAAMEGHKPVVELLLAEGAPVNERDMNLITPLMYAVLNNHEDVAVQLIGKGADVTVKNNDGQTLLDIAVDKGQKDTARLLLDNGAPVSSIHTAAALGLQGQVEKCLDRGADIDVKDARGRTPLYHAVLAGHEELVRFLTGQDADVNAEDGRGETPLHGAAAKGHKEVAEFLITKGADINAKKIGYTPLTCAVWNDDLDMARILVDHGAKCDVKDEDGWTAFRYAADAANREMIELLVAKGADVSGIHKAACVGDLARVKSLVEQGVAVDANDELGWTPLSWAASVGQEEVGEFLLSKGARANAKTQDESTPLHQASYFGALRLAELLISKGADVNAENRQASTPLHSAAAAGHRPVAELLISNGADINAKSQYGQTALHRAAVVGHREVAELLIAKGADVTIKDGAGRTALDLAEQRSYKEIVDLLRKHGAKE